MSFWWRFLVQWSWEWHSRSGVRIQYGHFVPGLGLQCCCVCCFLARL